MKYIILSLKHGSEKEPCFWKANDAGYTNSPFNAGIYTEEEVNANPEYYNNGFGAVAIPLTDAAMAELGFRCSYTYKGVLSFLQKTKTS